MLFLKTQMTYSHRPRAALYSRIPQDDTVFLPKALPTRFYFRKHGERRVSDKRPAPRGRVGSNGHVISSLIKEKRPRSNFPSADNTAPGVPDSLIPSSSLTPLDDPIKLNLGKARKVGGGARWDAQGSQHVIPSKTCDRGFGHSRTLK